MSGSGYRLFSVLHPAVILFHPLNRGIVEAGLHGCIVLPELSNSLFSFLLTHSGLSFLGGKDMEIFRIKQIFGQKNAQK